MNATGEAWAPGQQIGTYTIEAEIGRGPLGISYRAHDAEGEVVALKVLKAPSPLTDAEKAAIARDFHALEDLQSPQVPVLREFVRYHSDYVIATDFLPLGDLSGRLARGPLPLSAALTLIRHLTYAVGHAHAVGVVHGGIKPTNVLRREVNGRAVPVLTDFGGRLRDHAWICPAGAVDDSRYRAPELGGNAPHTPAADVYALGALLETLTGRFATRGVQSVVARATDASPKRRYKSAAEMFEALSSLPAEEPAEEPAAAPVVAAPAPAPVLVAPQAAEPVPVPEPQQAPAPAEAAALSSLPEPVLTAAVSTVEQRSAERARILNSASIAASEAGYRPKGKIIAGVAAVAVVALVLSLLLSKNNLFNRPHPVPAPQVLQVSPVYRGVHFQLQSPTQPGDQSHIRYLEVNAGKSWTQLGGVSYTAHTFLGGQRACVQFRTADQDQSNSDTTYSNAVSSCGTSQPPMLTVTIEPNNCDINGATEVCYNFAAGGLKPGTTSTLKLWLAGQLIGTLSLTVDGTGHAYLPSGEHFHFESTTGGQQAKVTYAGLTHRWIVANT